MEVEPRTSMFRALRAPDFRFIWGAQVLSELGDWAARVALAVLVLERTGSTILTAAVTGISMLPWVGLGQALAAFTDRLPRRTVMVGCDLIRAGSFVAIVGVGPVWVVFLLVFVAACATPPFEAARAAYLPEVVSEEAYGDALALTGITYQAVLVLGSLVGGGLVGLIGAKSSLLVNSLTFVGSAAFLAVLRGGRATRAAQAIGAGMREAVHSILSDPFLRRAAVMATIGGCSIVVAEALVAVYVHDNLRGDVSLIGVLAATVPTGTIVASALVRRRGEHAQLLRASALLLGLGAAGGIVWFLIEPPNLWVTAGYFSIGVASAMVVPAYTVVGSRLPERTRATAFAFLQGTVLGGQALAAVIGGALATIAGPGPAAAFALFPALGYATYAYVVPPRMAPGAGPQSEESPPEVPVSITLDQERVAQPDDV